MTSVSAIRILLIEDNITDALLLKENLLEIKNESFSLSGVETLRAAIEALKTAAFDVVIMDLNLPDSQGLETFVKFKNYARQIPVILLTGVDSYELGVQAVQMGAQDFLVKHYVQPNLLSHTIRYAIERHQLQIHAEENQPKNPSDVELSLLDELLSRVDIFGPSPHQRQTSLRTRNPALFASMVATYENVLSHPSVQREQLPEPAILPSLRVLGDELGQCDSRSRDILDIHTHALRQVISKMTESESLALLQGSRAAIISLMGYLVDFYRNHSNSS